MANRYWRGGSGTWNTTSTTNWSATSGGAGGASVPTAADSVFFDQAATYTVTMTGALNCLDITVSAGTVTFATGTTPTLSVAGSWSTIAGTVWNSTGTVTFTSTTSRTITSGGITIDTSFTFNGTGGTWTLQDNLTLNTTRTVSVTRGTLALGTYTLTTGAFTSNVTTARTINFGTGKIVLNGSTTATVWNTTQVANLTYSGSRIVDCIGGGTGVTKTITSANSSSLINFNLIENSGSVTYSFSTSSPVVIGNLYIDGNNQTIALNSTLRVFGSFNHLSTNGTSTFSSSNNSLQFWADNDSGNKILNYIEGYTYDLPVGFYTGFGANTILPSNLTLGANRTLAIGDVGVGGLFDFNGKTVICGQVTLSAYNVANTGSSNISLTVPVTSTGTTFRTDWITTHANGWTYVGQNGDNLNLFSKKLTTPKFVASGDLAGRRVITFGTGGQLALTGNNTTIFDISGSNTSNTLQNSTVFSDIDNVFINCTYTGNTGTRTIVGGTNYQPGSESSLLDISTSGSTGLVLSPDATDNIALGGGFNQVNFTGFIGTLTNTTRTIWGNLTIPASGGTYQGGSNITTLGHRITGSQATTTRTIDTSNRLLDFPITINSNNWVLQLLSNTTIESTRTLTLDQGNLFLNNFIFSTGFCNSSQATNGTRVIGFGTSGKLELTGNSGNIFNVTTSGLTTTGNAYIDCTYTGSTGTRTINTTGLSASAVFSVATSGTSGIVLNPSATDSVELSGGFSNIDFTGFTGTLTNTARTIYGNLIIPDSGGTYSAGANLTTLAAATGQTNTITTNGRTLDFPISIGNGTSNGTITLNSALTLGSTRTFTLVSGTYNCNNFTTTANVLVANGTATRAFNFGSTGQLTLVGSGGTIISMPTATGFSYTGTQKILSSYTGGTGTRTFALGNAAAISIGNTFNFNINGSNGIIIAGGTDTLTVLGQVSDFDIRNSTNILTNDAKTIYGNFYTSPSGGTINSGTGVLTLAGYSGSFIIDSANRVLDFPITINGNGNYTLNNSYISGSSSTVSTRAFTISTGNLEINNVSLFVGSFVSNTSNIRSINFTGTTGQMNLLNSGTTIWNSNSSSGFSLLGNYIINSTYTGNVGTRVFDFGQIPPVTAQPNVKVTTGTLGLNIGTANDSVTLTGTMNNLDLTGLLATVTNTLRKINGNLIIPAVGGTFTAGTNATTFVQEPSGVSSDPNIIDTSGRTLQFPIIFNGQAGNWILANNLVANATTVLTLTNGQIDFNQKSLTFANITLPAGATTFGISNLSTSLNFIQSAGNLNIISGAINCSTSGTYTISGGNLLVNSPFTTGAFTLTAGNVSANALLTTAAFTHTAGNMSVLTGGAVNTGVGTYTQNGGNVIINGGDLTTTTFTSNSGTTRSIQLTNGNINVTSTGTVVNMANTTALTSNGNGNIQITSSGSTAITVTPGSLAEANTINYNFIDGTYALTLTSGNVKGLNFNNYTGALGNSTITIFGNLALNTGMTISGAAVITLAGSNNQIVTTEGVTLDRPVTVNKAANAVYFNDISNLGTTRTFTLTAGTVSANANLTIGPVTHTAGTLFANAPVNTLAYTQNGGNVIINGGDLTTTTFTSSGSTARSIQLANGNINVTSTGTVVNMATTTNLTANGNGNIQITSSGSTAITVTPGSLAAANSINYKFTGGNYALTLTAGNVDNLDFTGYTGTVGDSAMTIFGNLILSTGMTRTAGASAWTFAPALTQYITTNGITLDCPITINGVNGNIIINDALTLGSARNLSLANGTLNLNGLTLSTGTFSTTTGTKNITFNGGTLTIVGSGATAFNNAVPTGFTTTKGTGNGTISMLSSTAKTFVGNSSVFACTLDNTGSANLTITGNNTFEVLRSSYAETTANANIILPSDGTTTVTSGIGGGTSNSSMFGLFGSSTPTRAELKYTNTGNVVADYVSVKDIGFISNTWQETSNGSMPWQWYLGSNSLNNGNSIGALFVDNDGSSAPIIYFISSGTTFTVPNNWNSSNNTVHVWGAGGGSAGSLYFVGTSQPRGGAGGGGGGYTKIVNFSASPGSNISYTIGSGGSAGASNGGSGGNGDASTFSSYSANGGRGATGLPGAGGIGGTYNGGTGGDTFYASSTENSAGAGGGGAGGPNGNGGNGGNGSITTTATNSGGGGGGGTGGGTNGINGATLLPGVGGSPFELNNGNYGYGGNGGAGSSSGGSPTFSLDILNSIGPGSGGGGGGANGTGGLSSANTFGSGAGGGGATEAQLVRSGRAGSNGGIIITYYASGSVFNSSNMFFMF